MLTTKSLGFICQHVDHVDQQVDPIYPFAAPSQPPLLTTILFSISVCFCLVYFYSLVLFFYFGHSVFVLSLFCSFLHMGEVMQYLSFSI